jgi:hypothetical protein
MGNSLYLSLVISNHSICGKYFTVDRVPLLRHKLGASNRMEFNL